MTKRIIFITGGARSGKSRFALELGGKMKGKKIYVATAEALDDEMRERVQAHKKQRGEGWDTLEEQLHVGAVVARVLPDYKVIVVDCLTLWLSNMLLGNHAIEREMESLVSALSGLGSSAHGQTVILVSNEVGLGIVPDNELSRKFRDLSGAINQRIATVSDDVYFVVAGIPMHLKGER